MNNQTLEQTQWSRLEDRKRVNLPARIDSQGARCLAVMQDISRCGGCLLVNRSFQVGTDILVALSGGVERRCIVRRCVPVPELQKFEIGFEVIEAGWPEDVLPADEE
jgi:hypothetical protein